MPILQRGRKPAQRNAAPAGPGRAPARLDSPTGQIWPGAIAVTAVIVFIIFVAQTTLVLALIMALATLVAGGLLLTLVSGTAWISQLRHLLTDLRR